MIVQDGLNLADNIKKTMVQLEKLRQPREEVFKEIIKYILPGLEDFLLKTQAGKAEEKGRYGGFGISQLELFADGMFGYLVAPSINWFACHMANEWQNTVPEIRDWTQDLMEHFRWRFSQTNFYDAMSTSFEHAGALGYANIYPEENKDNGDFIFHTYHPGEIWFSENRYGVVDTVFRKFKMDAHNAVKKFANDNLPETIKEIAKTSPYHQYEFIHAVYPRAKYDPKKLDVKNKPFASVWVCLDAQPNNNDVVREGGLDFNHYIIWRFKKARTPYGRGPAENALVEIKQDNVMWRSLLGVAQSAVEGPVQAPTEMEDRIDLGPRGVSWYSDPNRLLHRVDTNIQWPIGTDVLDRIRGIIEKHFKVEFFTLLAQRESVQPRTATEVIELQGEKAAVLGRSNARFQKELINPIFEAVYRMDMEAGRLPPPPDVLLEQGGEIKIELLGPLAQAQKRLFQMQGISAVMEYLPAFVELFGPQILDVIDGDSTLKTLLRTNGFDQDNMNPDNEIEAIRQARLQAQQELEERDQQAEQAETMKKLAMADKAVGNKISGLLTEGGEA